MLPKDLEPTFGNAQGKIFEIVGEKKKKQYKLVKEAKDGELGYTSPKYWKLPLISGFIYRILLN